MAEDIKSTLEHLAKEVDPSARSLLIRKLTAEYTRRTGHAPSDMERTLFSALVLDLYDQIDMTVRRDIITLLARTRHITTDLAERMAREADGFVIGLFEHSPMLNEDLLLRAVRARSEDVLVSIARRPEVSENLVDALMARAFVSVTEQLLRNHGAEFSSNALLLCSIICRTSLPIQALLAARCLKDQAFHLRLQKQVENGCPFLPRSFAKATKAGTLRDLAVEVNKELDMLELGGETVSREEAVVQVHLGELTFDSLLSMLIADQRKDDIIWFLKDAPGLSYKAMEHVLSSDGNRTLMRLLSERQVGLKTFEALMRWRIDALGYPGRHLYRDLEDYRQHLRHAPALAHSQ